MNRKLIILLSAKRCGSTAVFNMFQNHPDVKIFHDNQKINNWEIQFWSLANYAIKGNPTQFIRRLKKSISKLNINNVTNKKKVFDVMDQIFKKFGPVLFDKSPQYLGNKDAINLLVEYSKKRKVELKLIGLIRDPKDALMSQYILWNKYIPNDSLERREKLWIKQYQHLKELKKKYKLFFFNYENFSYNPYEVGKKIFKFCKLNFNESTIKHIRPISIGRFNNSIFFKEKKKWKWSKEFENHLKEYNYHNNKTSSYKNFFYAFKELKFLIHPNIRSKLKSFFFKKI